MQTNTDTNDASNETKETTPSLWTVDPVHTTVGFRVRHLMITNVHGIFEKVAGTIRYDAARPEASRVEVVIPADSIHTRDPQRDGHLRSPDFLDAAAHPNITFRSTRVRKGSGGPLEVVGDLTMRGTTREVTFTVNEITPEGRDYQGLRRIGASATGTLRRSEFGMTFNKLLDTGGLGIGDEVHFSIDVSLVEAPKESPRAAKPTS